MYKADLIKEKEECGVCVPVKKVINKIYKNVL